MDASPPQTIRILPSRATSGEIRTPCRRTLPFASRFRSSCATGRAGRPSRRPPQTRRPQRWEGAHAMTAGGWAQIALVLAPCGQLFAQPLGRFIVELFEDGRAHLPVACDFAAGGARTLPARGRRPGGRAGLARLYNMHVGLRRRLLSAALRALAAAECPSPEPARVSTRCPPDHRLSTRRSKSFITNANWQAYGGETTR